MVGTRSLSSGARSRDPLALPTLVLARSITLASFHEEWPSPGGHPGRAEDRLDRCPPKPLRAVFRSKIAIGTSSGPGWLKELRVRITREGRRRWPSETRFAPGSIPP